VGAVGEAEQALEQADASFAQGDLEAVVAHLSAAIRAFTTGQEPRRAAMACARLGDVYANGLGNVTASRAWFVRARRLVEDGPPCIEQGWVAVAAMGCEVDDPAELLASAELALDRARRFGDVNLETKALADAGLAHVQAGRVADGMALLEEAMALACGPADDTEAAAKSVCSFFTACYHAADFGRAGSWADLFRQRGLISSQPGGPLFLSSHCDSVQATFLMEVGRWGEAEALLQRARADFEQAMQMPSWHPDIALADLRVRQGRCADAEALLLGKDQSLQALLPAARLHLARGDHALARAAARRGLRAIRGDRLRAVELLTALVEVELASGALDAAGRACAELTERLGDLDVPVLQARAAHARAELLAATGDLGGAVGELETALDRLEPTQLGWLRVTLLVELARVREAARDAAGAAIDAKAAAAALCGLDVVLPGEDAALLERLCAQTSGSVASESRTAELGRDGRWWSLSLGGTSVRLPDTKGLCYLAELLRRPGAEQHALDLVDRVEGVAADGPSRRSLGDAGSLLDGRARTAYRRRIEELRADADEAMAEGRLEAAEAAETELEALVRQLAQAFGLGGRDRRAASAAERARLNVTRALRSAITKLREALPEAGDVLDRRIRTGLYCAYEPGADDGIRWIVHP
jgi:tetratricopeptide (TPR) repeat protein